jgi:hypothetical protein
MTKSTPFRGQLRSRQAKCVVLACVTLLTASCKSGTLEDSNTRPVGSDESTGTALSTTQGKPADSDTAPLFTGRPPDLSATIADDSAGSTSQAPVLDSRLQTCVPASGPGENLLIDDFEDEDRELPELEGRRGEWYSYEEISGDHQLTIEQLETARLDSKWAAHTVGSDHGYWAGFGVNLSGCVYDASAYVGLHFWIKGDSNPMNVAILTPGVVPVANDGACTEEESGGCWDAYKREVDVTGEWREYFLPFTEFEQDGYGQNAGPLQLSRLYSIEFQSDGGAFDVWVDDFGFYIEEVYTPLEPDAGETGSSVGETSAQGSTTIVADGGVESSTSTSTSIGTSTLAESSEDASSTPAVDGGEQ